MGVGVNVWMTDDDDDNDKSKHTQYVYTLQVQKCYVTMEPCTKRYTWYMWNKDLNYFDKVKPEAK
ncbi:CLUMA_CG006450, isoform A [Clunio marinus]|uniref:CLUMA_CG006450, isoform A n=1 Tax=Clunio marinus TaxID=568069 RepID=A0A1J1HX87_9DIPT|nr:CLUMA_CG006450, isoform A [Clunio marinus]